MICIDGCYGLDEKVVIDSLEGISEVCKDLDYALVGGLSASLYCCPNVDTDMLRKTDDADIIILSNGFKERIGRKLQKYLLEKGYDSRIKKPLGNYEVLVKGEDMCNPFFLHFSRYSKKLIKELGTLFKHEIENAKSIPIPTTDKKINVVRPEDIIPPKLHTRREKDMFDINLMIRYGPPLNLDEFAKSDLYWCGGSRKLVDNDIEEIKKIIQKVNENVRPKRN